MKYDISKMRDVRSTLESLSGVPDKILASAKAIVPPQDDEIMPEDGKKYDGEGFENLKSIERKLLAYVRTMLGNMEMTEQMNQQTMEGLGGSFSEGIDEENGLSYTENSDELSNKMKEELMNKAMKGAGLLVLEDIDFANFVGPMSENMQAFYDDYKLRGKMKEMGIPTGIIQGYAEYDPKEKKIIIGDNFTIYSDDGKGDVTFNINGKEQKGDETIKDLLKNGSINYRDLIDVDKITKENESIQFIHTGDNGQENVKINKIANDDNTFVVVNNYDGSIKNGYYVNENNNLESISMFGEYTLDNRTFGGRQGYFSQNASELLADPEIKAELERAYPGSTDAQKLAYLSNIVNKGCGYVAEVNSLFAHYEGREEDFKKTFGQDMYTIDSDGNLSFNYQQLVLEYYDYVYSDKGNKKIWQVNNSGSYMGVTPTEQVLFSEFLKENYGVNSTQTIFYDTSDARSYNTFGISDTVDGTWTVRSQAKGKEDVMSLYNQYMSEGHDAVIIGQRSGSSGHSMYVVGEENGDLVLSDQGRKVNPGYGGRTYSFAVIDYED